ncbi:YggT family protein [Nocardioides sp. AE5]|uniref:YggT family protein n=1 Tax=Nocardioides sp. AE5 TaxID=2962573 RepID=UPI0028825FA8|nr:YggT family protein [Nocardioides sp. AE5]MDT0201264.1 YggT family protein [Nocardioides sp. AE5]
MELIGTILYVVLFSFMVLLWTRFIFDWVMVFARSWSPKGPLLVVLEIVYSITDPPIKALRKVIPPLRLGSIALDLSFLIVLVGTYLLMRLNYVIFLSA